MIFDKLISFLKIQKFSSELQLIDGTLIQIDGVFGEPNVPVYLITSDGLKPLPDGDYQLGGDYEGTVITVLDGIITDVNKVDPEVEDTETPTETPTEAPPVEAPMAEVPVEAPVEAPEVEDDVNPLTSLENIVGDLIKRIEALEGKDTNMETEFNNMKVILEKMDGAKPIKKNIKEDDNAPLIVNSNRFEALKNNKKK